MIDSKNIRIAVIGLGYVGLPLAVEFSKKYRTIGLDINTTRVNELNGFTDKTLEIDSKDLRTTITSLQDSSDKGLICTTDINDTANCNVFIITVPTPTDKNNRPVLTPLIKASESVAKVLKKKDIVVYESTVYPGATEEECIPILENFSGLKYNKDFFAGYSPERINPGDKKHTVTKIRKVTSGSNDQTANLVDELYKSIITAGTFKASSIKVAEAAKVIENSQRDINIAFVNELSKIFGLLDIDTAEVLEAAATKWNFLPFQPGLVGGHCIGVDPFYLAQKAQEVGYNPEIILAGRRLNDSMGSYVGAELVKNMIKKGIHIFNSKVLMLGITFKQNCPDIRNSRAIDVFNELMSYNIEVDVYDPWADKDEVEQEYGINLITEAEMQISKYDGIVLTVSHNEFLQIDFSNLKKIPSVIYDVKSFLPKNITDARL